MIKVKIIKNEKKLEEVFITGHAMYDDFGKDIVCAAVSSIVTTTVNAIERIDKDSITYVIEPFHLKVKKENKTTNALLDNMVSLLEELEHEYPKNIKFI